jgi:hypothetical protein
MLSSRGHLASAKGSDQQTERVALQDTIRSAVGATISRQDAKQTIPVKIISNLGNDKAAGPLPGPSNPAPASSKKQLHLTRSQAARIVQKWWRGWRVWGLQREAIKTLRTAAAMLWKASALLEDSLAGQSTLTQKQVSWKFTFMKPCRGCMSDTLLIKTTWHLSNLKPYKLVLAVSDL